MSLLRWDKFAIGLHQTPSGIGPVRALLAPLLGIIGFIGIWWVVSNWLGSTRLPPPSVVGKMFVSLLFPSTRLAAAAVSSNGSLLEHLFYTARMFFTGVALGAISGYGLALAMARFRPLRDFLEPPIEVFRAVPPLALLPFLGMWAGSGGPSQILLVAIYVGLMMLITTITAIDNLDPLYVKFASTFGASRRRIFRSIVVPAIVPELIGGLRVTMGMAWGFQVVAELVGTRQGVGLAIDTMQARFMTTEIIATVLWVTTLALITDLIFLLFIRRITTWKP